MSYDTFDVFVDDFAVVYCATASPMIANVAPVRTFDVNGCSMSAFWYDVNKVVIHAVISVWYCAVVAPPSSITDAAAAAVITASTLFFFATPIGDTEDVPIDTARAPPVNVDNGAVASDIVVVVVALDDVMKVVEVED